MKLSWYVIMSVSMGMAAYFKKPRRVWLEQHPEDRTDADTGRPRDVFIDNSGLLLSSGDDKAFPAIRLFSEADIAEVQAAEIQA